MKRTTWENSEALKDSTLSFDRMSDGILIPWHVGPPGRNSSSSENSPGILISKLYTTAEIVQLSSPTTAASSTAAVLEVIEPPHSPTKVPYEFLFYAIAKEKC